MAYEFKDDIENALIDLPAYFEDGTFDELDEVYRKAKSFNELVEYKRNIMEVKEISLTHATEEPFNSDMYSVHSLVDNLLDVINEYEDRADDER